MLDRDIELPFIGFEQALYDAVIAGLLERGESRESIARLFEMLAVLAGVLIHRFQFVPYTVDREVARA